MTESTWEYTLPIFASILLFGMLSVFILYFVLLYRRSQLKFKIEKEALQRTILQSRVEIQEATLKYVGRELHDNLGQIASLIKLNLMVATMDRDQPNLEKIDESKNLMAELIKDIKALSTSLIGTSIERLGLAEMLKRDVDRINKTGTVSVKLHSSDYACVMEADREIVIFRLCQEMLSNMLQHSQATEAEISAMGTGQGIEIRYRDNGKGFDVNEVTKNAEIGGNGLRNMAERARQVGCKLEVDSKPGAGTMIRIYS